MTLNHLSCFIDCSSCLTMTLQCRRIVQFWASLDFLSSLFYRSLSVIIAYNKLKLWSSHLCIDVVQTYIPHLKSSEKIQTGMLQSELETQIYSLFEIVPKPWTVHPKWWIFILYNVLLGWTNGIFFIWNLFKIRISGNDNYILDIHLEFWCHPVCLWAYCKHLWKIVLYLDY